MSVKIKISSDRFEKACNIYEYLAILSGDKNTSIKVLPRFVYDENAGDYIMGITHDEDGDIQEYTNTEAAVKSLFGVTPKRIEKIAKELQEAAKQIVNPTSEGG